ncbi:MAG: dTDP-4-dehydrorhamnose 3,5-epimerase [Prochlorococcus sp. SP3034]|nr:dTDP-4-dehydrorhamnose 3,5-epimerase [Prochlorococcus sp. SP3034]
MEYTLLSNAKGEEVEGPLVLTPNVFNDERGYFYESWNEKKFNTIIGKEIRFAQDNISHSFKGVLRGLHYQLEPEPQGKLVRCSNGSIFDVAVDMRKKSKTFGKWVSAELSEENKNQLWIPVGFAHGFLTISDHAEVNYKATGFWNKDCEHSIRWNDNDLKITWPIMELGFEPIINEKDASAPFLKESILKGNIF